SSKYERKLMLNHQFLPPNHHSPFRPPVPLCPSPIRHLPFAIRHLLFPIRNRLAALCHLLFAILYRLGSTQTHPNLPSPTASSRPISTSFLTPPQRAKFGSCPGGS